MKQTEKVLLILNDGQWHNTGEIMEKTRITRVGARIWDLKKAGKKIETGGGFTVHGFREYRIVKTEPSSRAARPEKHQPAQPKLLTLKPKSYDY